MKNLLNKIGGKRLIIWSIILFVIYLGIQFYNRTDIFTDTTINKAQYLAFEDYQLYDYDDNSRRSNTNNIISDDVYEFYRPDYETPVYKTSKGISVGSTFEDFLKAYGDYYIYSASAYESDYTGEKDEEYYSTHYVHSMLLNDYVKNYIDSGKIDINKNEITIHFTMFIKGKDIAFSIKEHDQMIEKKYDNPFPSGSIFNPEIQEYSLDFTFDMNEENQYILDYISCSRYVY